MSIAQFIRNHDSLRSLARKAVNLRGKFALRAETKYRGEEFKRTIGALSPSDAPRVWHACVPHHGNLGDRAQWLCIQRWLRENYPDREILHFFTLGYLADPKYAQKKLKELIGKDDLIVFQSGYVFTGESRPEPIYYWLAQNFPHNKFVFMPATYFFRNEQLKARSKARYENLDATFIARERTSFEIAQEMFPNKKTVLCPDIVTTMIGRTPIPESERDGVLFCIRNDSERYYSDEDLSRLVDSFGNIRKAVVDTNVKLNPHGDAEVYKNAILAQIQDFSTYRCIATDRFHGVIFSLVANTPVVVLKTQDHKVTGGADWFTGVFPDFIRKTTDLEDARRSICELLEKNVGATRRLDDYFYRTYYKDLKSIVER